MQRDFKITPLMAIIAKFIYLFIWGFTSLSTLYRLYHEG